MRIHLGHHFYGAGNLGDDFMLAGFLAAMQRLRPDATFTCSVPFPLPPLQARFPQVEWQPYDETVRRRSIAACDVWLGLGGSPFQSALSRWFVDHLTAEAGACRQAGRPMFFLGVGVQNAAELGVPEIRALCGAAAGIWTRDTASAERLLGLFPSAPIRAASDLAHLFFRAYPPPEATRGRLTAVFNFDYGTWPGQAACLAASRTHPAAERIWLAQESRELPGAERALHAALAPADQSLWRLVAPEEPGAPLASVLGRWPSGEWLLSSRYHAALAGAWAGSRVIVIPTNEKLRAAAADVAAEQLPVDAGAEAVACILQSARPATPPVHLAQLAWDACTEFIRSAVAHRR